MASAPHHPNTADFENQSTDISLCRLCLKDLGTSYHQNLFSVVDETQITVAEMINYCTNLNFVEDDNNDFPKNICPECFVKLEISYNFKVGVLQADEMLRSQELFRDFIVEESGVEEEGERDGVGENGDIIVDESDQIEDLDLIIGNDDFISEEFVISDDVICEDLPGNDILLEINMNEKLEPIEPPALPIKKQVELYSCSYCSKSNFTSRETLKNHIRHHVKSKQYQGEKCPECQKVFYMKDQFYQHNCVSSASLKCYICLESNFQFQSLRAVDEHIAKCHAADKVCSKCVPPTPFQTPQKLNRHMKGHVIPGFFIMCQFCPRKFMDRNQLRKHEFLHKYLKKEMKFQCDLCNFDASFKYNLKRHLMSVHLKEKFKCDFCLNNFSSADVLKSHKIRAHGMESNIGCVSCRRKFRYQSQLKTHLTMSPACRNSSGNAEIAKSIEIVKCSFCSMEFGNKTNLKRHEALHRKHGANYIEKKKAKPKADKKLNKTKLPKKLAVALR
jgi:hypothetical protein